MYKIKDLTGQKFGRLIVVKRAENAKDGQSQWLCRCDCGNEKVVRGIQLKNGKTKSCGCLKSEKIAETHKKHGLRYIKLYYTWLNIKQRCFYSKANRYKDYGGRGIKVCQEWQDNFMNFYNWSMNNGYSNDLTIDRINVNGNYEPNNCRWITQKEQCNNKRNNHLITYNNETHTVMQWCEITGIGYNTLLDRIKKYGWSIERALTTPVRKFKK